METSFKVLVHVLIGLAALDALVVLAVMIVKSRQRRAYTIRTARIRAVRQALLDRDGPALQQLSCRAPRQFAALLRATLEVCGEDAQAVDLARLALDTCGLVELAARDSRSVFLHRRMSAYLTLGLRDSAEAMAALFRCLRLEHSRLGRMAILRQIAVSRQDPPMDELLHRLDAMKPPLDATEFKALEALSPRLHGYFAGTGHHGDVARLPASDTGLKLFMMGVRSRPDRPGWEQLSLIAESRDDSIGALAARTMAAAFPPSWFIERYEASRESRFMEPCAGLLGTVLSPGDVERLVPWLELPELCEAGIQALIQIDKRHPEQSGEIMTRLMQGSDAVAMAVSRALEYRLKYLAYHEQPQLSAGFRRMLACLLEQNRPGALLSILETALPAELRTAIMDHVRSLLETRPGQRAFFSRHASEALRSALGAPPPPAEENRPRIPVKLADKVFLAALVLLALAVFPLVFAIRWWDGLGYLNASELLYRFIFDFHYLFAWYTIAVNSFYLLLLLLSAVKLQFQSLLWGAGLRHFLLSSGLLPTVTIIAPAYNEEKTIADSVESLLSLAYPHYQVVVVNDGSKDDTITALVRAFGLEPAAPGGIGTIPSMPVRTTYRSSYIPNLLVLDKTNGGKADALNAGINHAGSEYVCCIDADSLLEPQSLLRAMLQVLARRRPTIAIGGNIFPVNGSVVDHGHLQRIGLPAAPLAAFQTIEYLRSFVSGRLGWALIDGLLIISGAFGVFRRDRVLEAGGYMTGKGLFRKDTVGEDMELVVRLLRRERESGRNGTVDYCYNANCWTEVPEDGKALGRQRDRWHRGLIEVLLHHRVMVLNSRYGTSGLVSIPYFYLFELIGPWLELSGYAVLGASLVLALINPLVSLMVFSIAVGFGILISLCSILLAERQVVYFRPREFFGLLFLAFTENFGFRQLMSMSRVWAFVQFFYLSKGWQKMARKGFARAAVQRP
jgi:cellulose synthase/poly-beta-1,6-N-acetylglucosamine synthase-like glycosyltransferase